MDKVHRFILGRDCRDSGQTDYEYRHTAVCGYVRNKVTHKDDEVTCKICLRDMKQELS